jgi:hypothetical protein
MRDIAAKPCQVDVSTQLSQYRFTQHLLKLRPVSSLGLLIALVVEHLGFFKGG